MFEVPDNIMTITSVMGYTKITLEEKTDSLGESMGLVVKFFIAEGFEKKTIKNALLEIAEDLE